MVSSIYFLVFVCVVCIASCERVERFQPTRLEKLRALAFQTPRDNWGYQARQEKDLRVFIIGGSNTKYHFYPDAIINDFKTTSAHPDWRGSLNLFALSGVHEEDLIGRKFEFENLNPSQWPNVIMIEVSVNVLVWQTATISESMDVILSMIRMKYRKFHLREPDFMFLEMLNVRGMVDDMVRNGTYEHKMSKLQEMSRSDLCDVVPFEHCADYFAIRKVAAFYDYPMVSWRELVLNAFLRYYLATNVGFKATPWSYTMDGLHVSIAGSVVLYQTLLGPFFHQIMTSRNEPKWDRNGTTTPLRRMFPPSNQSIELTNENVTAMIRQPNLWHLSTFKGDVDVCSTNKQANLTLDFNVPADCDHFDCSVSVGFVHSWNATSYGDLDCELSSTKPYALISRVEVKSTADQFHHTLHHTGVMSTTFKMPRAGSYTLACNKLDTRETCLNSFVVHRMIEV